jgi:hypothetical protein
MRKEFIRRSKRWNLKLFVWNSAEARFILSSFRFNLSTKGLSVHLGFFGTGAGIQVWRS